MKHRILKHVLTAAVATSGLVALAESVNVESTTRPTTTTTSPTTKPVTDAEINALIGQLDNSDSAIAGAAKSKLVAIGERAKPALERRLREETAAADLLSSLTSLSFLAPTKINLHLSNATPDQAIDALAKEIGVSFKPRNKSLLNTSDVKISCDFNQAPFWAVVQEICNQGNLQVNSSFAEGQFSLTSLAKPEMKNPITSFPVSNQGSVLIVLKDFGRGKPDEANPARRTGDFPSGTLEVWCEPKLRPLRISTAVRVDEATDDQGHSLLSDAPGRALEYRSRYSLRLPVRTSFELAEPAGGAGKRIKTLRGKVGLVVPVEEQKIDLSDLLSNKEVVKTMPDGKTFTFSGFKRVQNRSIFTVDYDGELPIVVNATDGAGAKFSQSAQSPGRRAIIRLQIDGDNGKPADKTVAKLIWLYFPKSQEIQVPFEFKDLALP